MKSRPLRIGPNACPRCDGWVTADRDAAGRYLSCLNCGWTHDLAVPGGVSQAPPPIQAPHQGKAHKPLLPTRITRQQLRQTREEHLEELRRRKQRLRRALQQRGQKPVHQAARELGLSERQAYRILTHR